MIKTTTAISDLSPGEVIYFTGPGCQPCKQLKPQYARASVLDADRTYHVIDVTQCDPELVDRYHVMSVPRIYFLKNGLEEAEITARTADAIVDQVRRMK